MIWQIKGLPRREIPLLNNWQFSTLGNSLPKWQFLAWHPAGSHWTEPECACCGEYFGGAAECSACPISKVAGRSGCLGTPYISWYIAGSQLEADAQLQFLEGIFDIELHRRQYPDYCGLIESGPWPTFANSRRVSDNTSTP